MINRRRVTDNCVLSLSPVPVNIVCSGAISLSLHATCPDLTLNLFPISPVALSEVFEPSQPRSSRVAIFH
jgi:hypothetical protein